MIIKKLLAFGLTAVLCVGMLSACSSGQTTDNQSGSEQTAENAAVTQAADTQTTDAQTAGTQTAENSAADTHPADSQATDDQTKDNQMNETDTKNETTVTEAPSPAPDKEGMANGFTEEASGNNSGEQENITGTPEEELPTDENGIVIDCPKSASDRRAGMEYGTVTHIKYYSETTNFERGANILLPAGYSEDKKYPVVYFQHGIFGDEYGLINDGNNKIKEIFGNLAADGLTREFIVVFTNMYATDDPSLTPGLNSVQIAPYDNFINDLINDLMPYMEENHSILTGRENTGLIGFSMGGRESLYVGLMRPDLFAYTCGISPAPGLTPGTDWAMTHVGQLSEDELVFPTDKPAPELYMLCCGTVDSVVGKFPASYHEILTRNGMPHIWYEIPGANHDNRAIRSGIYNFLIRWNAE